MTYSINTALQSLGSTNEPGRGNNLDFVEGTLRFIHNSHCTLGLQDRKRAEACHLPLPQDPVSSSSPQAAPIPHNRRRSNSSLFHFSFAQEPTQTYQPISLVEQGVLKCSHKGEPIPNKSELSVPTDSHTCESAAGHTAHTIGASPMPFTNCTDGRVLLYSSLSSGSAGSSGWSSTLARSFSVVSPPPVAGTFLSSSFAVMI